MSIDFFNSGCGQSSSLFEFGLCDEAYVCNNQKPRFHSGQMSNINQFKADTGYILKSGEIITII